MMQAYYFRQSQHYKFYKTSHFLNSTGLQQVSACPEQRTHGDTIIFMYFECNELDKKYAPIT